MRGHRPTPHIAVIGGGFAGLAAGYELTRQGVQVTLLEAAPTLGGLAGSFLIGDQLLEKFYHHWFAHEESLVQLIEELGVEDQIVPRPSNTGIYYNKRIHRLTSPLDLLRFTPLPFVDRCRLLWLAIRSRQIKDWRPLEEQTAAEWIIKLGGRRVFEVIWEPLLRGKFGPFADTVSATYLWATLNIHGGQRRRLNGTEQLWYYKGGFGALAQQLAERIQQAGGVIRMSEPAERIEIADGRVEQVWTKSGPLAVDGVIATIALPLVADLLGNQVAPDYLASLCQIEYLASVCLVLVLDRSLSSTYWLSVSDPSFPFVGVIEHTNFEPPSCYGGKHIAYLSKYVVPADSMYRMSNDELVEFSLPYIQRMFPDFRRNWVLDAHVWRGRWAQPIAVRNYSAIVPANETPIEGLYLASMAQIYPEDRAVSRSIREGRRIAHLAIDRGRCAVVNK